MLVSALRVLYLSGKMLDFDTDDAVEKLTHMDMTDKDWPQFMRVHPVIDWTYAQVWKFLKVLEVDYCSLYDQG